MYRVIACLTEQHNPWLVLLAAAICLSASTGVFFVLDGLAGTPGKTRDRWLFLAAIVAGGGTWATHFVAMLGYDPGLPMGFHIEWTLLSALICIVGALLAFEVFARFPTTAGRIASGVLLGGAIVAMHYSGMAGVDAGAAQVWHVELVLLSWVFSAGFAIAALFAFHFVPSRFRIASAVGLLVLAIVSLHFTAMGALELQPDPRLVQPASDLNRPLLALTVSTGAAAALLIGVVLTFADRRVAATELAAAKQAMEMALHDSLTGLPNRRHLRERLQEYLDACKNGRLAVVAVDLDRFKPINDLYGHAVGDELLVRIARLLREEVGDNGFVARFGGDEFILILPITSDDALIRKLSTIVARFDNPIQLTEHQASVGATMGVAMAPADGLEADLLLRRADVALYRAKDDGRGRFAFFETGMDARVNERAALEHDLRSAIRNDEIVPHFQPLVQLESGEISGYEVLARWNHPTRGNIEPSKFIKIAEETGLIGELSINLLRRSCREMLDWTGAPRMSLNIAAVQLRDPTLPQKLLRILSECGFPPARLDIEITEDALVSDFDAARSILASLKNLGVHISLDDFGTGYSSLRHLRELPFDALKIDRSFVHSMGESDEALTIVKTIVQLAKNLGLGVTAEGIETPGQAQELQVLGCDRGQGFLLGRPRAGAVIGTGKNAASAA